MRPIEVTYPRRVRVAGIIAAIVGSALIGAAAMAYVGSRSIDDVILFERRLAAAVACVCADAPAFGACYTFVDDQVRSEKVPLGVIIRLCVVPSHRSDAL